MTVSAVGKATSFPALLTKASDFGLAEVALIHQEALSPLEKLTVGRDGELGLGTRSVFPASDEMKSTVAVEVSSKVMSQEIVEEKIRPLKCESLSGVDTVVDEAFAELIRHDSERSMFSFLVRTETVCALNCCFEPDKVRGVNVGQLDGQGHVSLFLSGDAPIGCDESEPVGFLFSVDRQEKAGVHGVVSSTVNAIVPEMRENSSAADAKGSTNGSRGFSAFVSRDDVLDLLGRELSQSRFSISVVFGWDFVLFKHLVHSRLGYLKFLCKEFGGKISDHVQCAGSKFFTIRQLRRGTVHALSFLDVRRWRDGLIRRLKAQSLWKVPKAFWPAGELDRYWSVSCFPPLISC